MGAVTFSSAVSACVRREDVRVSSTRGSRMASCGRGRLRQEASLNAVGIAGSRSADHVILPNSPDSPTAATYAPTPLTPSPSSPRRPHRRAHALPRAATERHHPDHPSSRHTLAGFPSGNLRELTGCGDAHVSVPLSSWATSRRLSRCRWRCSWCARRSLSLIRRWRPLLTRSAGITPAWMRRATYGRDTPSSSAARRPLPVSDVGERSARAPARGLTVALTLERSLRRRQCERRGDTSEGSHACVRTTTKSETPDTRRVAVSPSGSPSHV